ncbi:MAG: helix-turn-helix domain-containing protein [Enterococcus sp.]
MFQISLKAARINAGFTMSEAAKNLEIYSKMLSKYEKDSSNISLVLLDKMAHLYQIPEDYIFLGKESELIRILSEKGEKM